MSYQYFLAIKHLDDSAQDLLIFSTTTGSRLGLGSGLKKKLIEKILSSHLKEKISLGDITDVIIVSVKNKEILSWIPPISLAKADSKNFSSKSFLTNLEGLDRHVSIEEIQKHF